MCGAKGYCGFIDGFLKFGNLPDTFADLYTAEDCQCKECYDSLCNEQPEGISAKKVAKKDHMAKHGKNTAHNATTPEPKAEE